jgi:hypothetical protein
MRHVLTAALFSLVTLPALAAAPAMQPGLYEVSVQMVLKGMPMQLPVSSFRHCITPQDIVNGNAYASSETSKDCQISNLRQNGAAVSYDFACVMPGGGSMVGHSSGTSHATGYDVSMSGRFVPATQGMSEFGQKMRARRLGACP